MPTQACYDAAMQIHLVYVLLSLIVFNYMQHDSGAKNNCRVLDIYVLSDGPRFWSTKKVTEEFRIEHIGYCFNRLLVKRKQTNRKAGHLPAKVRTKLSDDPNISWEFKVAEQVIPLIFIFAGGFSFHPQYLNANFGSLTHWPPTPVVLYVSKTCVHCMAINTLCCYGFSSA